MKRIAVLLISLVSVLLICSGAQAAWSTDVAQLVKTREPYWVFHENGNWMVSSFICQVDSFTPEARNIRIDPNSGDSGRRTVYPISWDPYWVVQDEYGQLGMQVYFHFDSLKDVGQWSITCNGTFSDPNDCEWPPNAPPPGFNCPPDKADPWANPFTYFVTVFNQPATTALQVSDPRRVGNTLTFNANANDPDHSSGSLRYNWALERRPPGSTANLSDAAAAAPTANLSNKHDIGKWDVRLKVTDVEGELTEVLVGFEVENQPPTLAVTGLSSIDAFQHINLTAGPSTDADGETITWVWDILDAPQQAQYQPQSNFHTGQMLDFVTGTKDIGTWKFKCTATDEHGASVSDTVTVVVENQPPTLAVTGLSSIDAFQHINLTAGPSTDADGETITWVWDILDAPQQAQYQPQSNFRTGQVLDFATGTKDIGTWRFKCTATDEHGASVSDTVTVVVNAVPPRITLIGESMIKLGDTIHLETTTLNDDYGERLHFRWDILQVPVSAGIGLITGYGGDYPSIDIPTSPGQLNAGTWVFKLTVTDQFNQTADKEASVLVDADPVAAIFGPEQVGNLTIPLELDGSSSVDPDSPVNQQDCGHLHVGPVECSRAIVRYLWILLQGPDDLYGRYYPGHVDELLNVDGSNEVLHIPAGKLPPGDWLFELEVTDGEGNHALTTHQVQVLDEGSPPLVILSPPALYNTDINGVTAVEITADGSQSFDLDNLLDSPRAPGLGITDYHWQFFATPPDCSSPPSLPSGSNANRAVLYSAGALVPWGCLGTYQLGLTVTDDDTPTARTNTNVTQVMIGNCAGAICIDYPTQAMPQSIRFSSQTDVIIYYHLNSLLYDDPAFAAGLRVRMDIFHESNPGTPVNNQIWSVDPLPSDFGGVLAIHWSGFFHNRQRPVPGKYTVTLQLINAAGNPTGYSATESQAIWIQTLDVQVSAGADIYLNANGLVGGTDHLLVNYQVTGQQPGQTGFNELRYRIFNKATAAKVFEGSSPGPYTGSFTWDGDLGTSDFLPPGKYEVELEILDGGASLGVSARHEFLCYGISLALTGISPENTLTPGAFITETGDIDASVTLDSDPTTLSGQVHLQTEDESGTLTALDGATPVDIEAGVEIPTTSFTPSKSYHLRGARPSSGGKTTIAASYQPPGTTVSKRATAKAAVTVLRTHIRSAGSDPNKQASDGVFVGGSTSLVAISPANFDLFKFQMRPISIELRPDISGASAELAFVSGSAANVEFFEAVGGHAQVTLPKTWTTADFTGHRLTVPLLAYGKTYGEVVLALTYRNGTGAQLGQEKIKLRVEPFPGATGVAIPGEFPYFRVVRTVNVGSPVVVSLDPFRHRERLGKKAAIYVVVHKTPAQWAADPGLVDLSGGPNITTVQGPSVANNLTVAWPAVAPGAYDVVYDFGNFADNPDNFVADGRLDPGDILDAGPNGGASVTALGFFTTPGPAATATAVYGIGNPTTTVPVPTGFDGMVAPFSYRLRGQVVYPAALAAPAPLVVFAHGNHTPRTVTTAAFGIQTVSSLLTSDENFRGYTYLQQHLASLGYVTLSVDLDEMYGDATTGYPAMYRASSSGIKVRAWITLKNIEKVLTDSTIAGGALSGKIDVSRIYLVGHSRGGEAVIVALDQLKNPAHRPIGGTLGGFSSADIKGIVSLSPVTQAIANGGIAPQDVPFLLLYGSADGDVNGAMPSVAPFRHYDRAVGDRFSVRIVGGNHNHFNESWGYDDSREEPHFGGAVNDYSNMVKVPLAAPVGAPATLVDGPKQRDFAKAYLAAFLSMVEGTNPAAQAFFVESPARLRPLGVDPGLVLYSQAELRVSATLSVADDYETQPALTLSSSGQTVTTNAAGLWEGFLFDTSLGTVDTNDRFFQETRGALFAWNSPAEYVEHLAPADQNLRSARVISFRVAQQPSHPNTAMLAGPARFSVELEDVSGHKSAMDVHVFDSVPAIYPAFVAGVGSTTSAAFETFRLPVAGFAADGANIDLAHIALIRIKLAGLGQSMTGAVSFDDLEVER